MKNIVKLCKSNFYSYFKADILKICLYGFTCGMNLLLSGNTINFWLASYNIDVRLLGVFSCVALPYAFKYFIALFIDNVSFFSQKNKNKFWLVISQLMLILALFTLSFLKPQDNLIAIAIISFLIAFFATIQDIILNANRIKILKKDMQANGNAIYNVGYRLGMLFSGAGIILASVYISWQKIFLLLSCLYCFLLIVMMLFYREVRQDNLVANILDKVEGYFYNLFIKPFKNFLSFKNFLWILIFISLYRLGDNMLVVMLNPFLLDLGYTAFEIANISKFFGTLMVILGGFISAPVINKLGLRSSLVYFSVLHTMSHFLLISLSISGKNIPMLYIITAFETLTGGMMTVAHFMFISNLCSGYYIATQYALLSSFMGVSRVILPSGSGLLVSYLGFTKFFIVIILISILVTIFTYFMPKSVLKN